jgi:hypothetical protein
LSFRCERAPPGRFQRGLADRRSGMNGGGVVFKTVQLCRALYR